MTSYCPAPNVGPKSPADNDYKPGFSADLMLKDLRLSQIAADLSGLHTQMGALATELYRCFVEDSDGSGQDFSAMLPHIPPNRDLFYFVTFMQSIKHYYDRALNAAGTSFARWFRIFFHSLIHYHSYPHRSFASSMCSCSPTKMASDCRFLCALVCCWRCCWLVPWRLFSRLCHDGG